MVCCLLQPSRMGRARGMTLLEVASVLAIVSVLLVTAGVGVEHMTRAARMANAKVTVVSAFSLARQRAMALGVDVYLLFAHVESTEKAPSPDAARVLVYQDRGAAMRTTAGALDDLMSVVTANPSNVFERFGADGTMVGTDGLHFVLDGEAPTPGCEGSAAPPVHLGVRGERRTQRLCTRAWCTFCEVQSGECIGAIRFSPDGQARVVTGPAAGSGGLIKVVDPKDEARSACIAFGEPTGRALAL